MSKESLMFSQPSTETHDDTASAKKSKTVVMQEKSGFKEVRVKEFAESRKEVAEIRVE